MADHDYDCAHTAAEEAEAECEVLRARVAKLESEASAMFHVIQVADELRGWQTTAPPPLVAEYDAARAAMRKVKP